MKQKIQLNEMISLIKRMDSPQSGWQTILQENVIDEYKDETGLGRREYTDIDQFMKEIIPVPNWYVGLGYIQNYEIGNVYPNKPMDPNNRNFTQKDFLGQYRNVLGTNARMGSKLDALVGHSEMSEPSGRASAFASIPLLGSDNQPVIDPKTGKQKSSSFKSMKEGNPFTSVLKVTTYNFRWENYAKSLEKQNLGRANIRNKAGFGYPEDSYDDTDWRRNPDFFGVGSYPSYEVKKNEDGSQFKRPYTNLKNANFNVYGDNDSHGIDRFDGVTPEGEAYQKRVMKALIPVGNSSAIYCAIDANGEIDDIEKSLFNLLGKNVVSSFAKAKITSEMSDDEKKFRQEMADFENATYSPQWFFENIAYVVGKGKDVKTGESVPYRFINKNIILQYQTEVNKEEMADVINKCSEKAYRDVIAKQNAIDKELFNKVGE